MSRIMMEKNSKKTVSDVFEQFIFAEIAKGIKEKTIKSYRAHFHSLSKRLDTTIPISVLSKTDLDGMIVKMRDEGLAPTTIKSYTGLLKVFFSWCNREGFTSLNIPLYKAPETVIETYTDEELFLLLKKPPKNCKFVEYRNWVIINFFMNCGCRASTVRNIQNKDVDLEQSQVLFRHTKNGKLQIIPLCATMREILYDYMKIRKGNPSDYLFCNEFGDFLSENALRLTIAKYNRNRGVERTSIHQFRHTFAKKYLLECDGNAFVLQKLLGHSTLKMTKHYCNLFDTDLIKDYDSHSPLTILNSKSNLHKIKK